MAIDERGDGGTHNGACSSGGSTLHFDVVEALRLRRGQRSSVVDDPKTLEPSDTTPDHRRDNGVSAGGANGTVRGDGGRGDASVGRSIQFCTIRGLQAPERIAGSFAAATGDAE